MAFVSPMEAIETASAWRSVADLGGSDTPLLAVDLRAASRSSIGADAAERLADDLAAAPWVSIALVEADPDPNLAPLVDGFDVVLGDRSGASTAVDVDDPDAELAALTSAVRDSPDASVALVQLLRLAADAPIEQALHAESLTYATLQTGPTFQTWLAARDSAAPHEEPNPVVLTERDGGLLRITLDRPDRRNALNVAMRDQLFEALELLELDRSLDGAVLRGNGPNFSAGGDLDEFGTTPSPAAGHRVRTLRSLPRLVHRVRDRLRVHLHGSCVGAGIELPAFAHSVIAHPDATFRLPEIGFGLVPGAGGTVSVSRRCGRQRTAWWALRGVPIDAPTARSWGLIDRIDG